MRSSLLVFGLGILLATSPGEGQTLVEIGYVESFDASPQLFSISRGSTLLPVSLLAPIYAGDKIRVNDPTASIRLRLVDRPGLLVISKANEEKPITAEPAKSGSYLTPMFEWVARTINVFDTEERELVATNIRGGGSEFKAGILDKPQTLVAGSQSIVLGWTGARQVDISIRTAQGREIANARGTGGLWASPPLILEPGRLTVQLTDAGKTLKQNVEVVAADKAPKVPANLVSPSAPAELRGTASAAWLAANGDNLMLAALQKVAPYARDSQPARLMTRALVAGRRPADAPPAP